MTILLKDFPESLIPFSNDRIPLNIFVCVLTFAETIFVGLLILSILGNLRKQSHDNDLKYILSGCVGDLFALVNMLIFSVINYGAGGWYLGRLGCHVNEFLFITAFGVSISSTIGLSIHRYMHIIKQVTIHPRRVIQSIIGFWVSIPSLLLVFFFVGVPGEGIALQSSGIYCFQATWSKIRTVIISTAIIISIVFIGFIAITICNFSLVALIRSAKQKKGKREKELQLTKRAVALSLGFLVGWFPMLIKIVSEFATKEPASDWLDIFSGCFVIASPALNGILLLMYDPKIKRSFSEIMGLEKLKTYKLPSSARVKLVTMHPAEVSKNAKIIKPDIEIQSPTRENFFSFPAVTNSPNVGPHQLLEAGASLQADTILLDRSPTIIIMKKQEQGMEMEMEKICL